MPGLYYGALYTEGAVMGNKLRDYIKALRELLDSGEEIADIEGFKAELLREIQFWQHERLIHLLVTMLFAFVTVAVLLVLVFAANLALLMLFAMLMVLLVPYIRHYYILENGVQMLYAIYEEICRRTLSKDIPQQCIPVGYGIRVEPLTRKKNNSAK